MRKRNSFARRIVVMSVVLIALFLCLVTGISYYVLRKLVYPGDRVMYGKKFSDLTQEIRTELFKRSDISKVSFKTSDNLELAAYWIKRSNPKVNLILCHGFKSCKEFMYGFIDLFPNWNILLFDFRANGQSQGGVTTIGCHEYKDVIAAAHFLRKQTLTSSSRLLPLIILGVSMGAASVLKAAEVEQDLCDVLISDSSYSQLKDIVFKVFSTKSNLPTYPFFQVTKQMFQLVGNCDMHTMNLLECVKSIAQPILFIHSCDDRYVSPKNSLRLYTHAHNRRSQIWIGPSCRHGWLHAYHGSLYKKKITKFLNRVLPSLTA